MRRAATSTVASLFFAQARRDPSAVAVADGGRMVTYGALATRVRKLAQVLSARGLGPGARVAVLSENRAGHGLHFEFAGACGPFETPSTTCRLTARASVARVR